jgi:hypothetical protein
LCAAFEQPAVVVSADKTILVCVRLRVCAQR